MLLLAFSSLPWFRLRWSQCVRVYCVRVSLRPRLAPRGRGDHGLAEGQAAVVGRDDAVAQDVEPVLPQAPRAGAGQQGVAEHAAGEGNRLEAVLFAGRGAQLRDEGGDGVVEGERDPAEGRAAFEVCDDGGQQGCRIRGERRRLQ